MTFEIRYCYYNTTMKKGSFKFVLIFLNHSHNSVHHGSMTFQMEQPPFDGISKRHIYNRYMLYMIYRNDYCQHNKSFYLYEGYTVCVTVGIFWIFF